MSSEEAERPRLEAPPLGTLPLVLAAGVAGLVMRLLVAEDAGLAPTGPVISWLQTVGPEPGVLRVPPLLLPLTRAAEALGPDGAVQVRAMLGGVAAAGAALLAGRLSPWAPRLAAGIAGLLAAALPAAVVLDLHTASGALVAAVVVLVALLAEGALRHGGLPRALLTGLAVGLLVAAEPLAVLVLPLLALGLLLRRRVAATPGPALVQRVGPAAALLLAGLAGTALAPTPLGQGPDLAAAFDPAAAPAPVPVDHLPDALAPRAERARLVASRAAGEWLDAEQTEAAWRQRGLDALAAHPGRALGLVLWRAHRLVRTPELVGSPELQALAARAPFGEAAWRLSILGSLGLVGLGAAAIGGRRRRGLAVVALFLGLLFGLALLRPGPQAGAALLPLFAAGIGAAVVVLARALQERRFGVLGGLLVATVALRGLVGQPPDSPALPGPALAAAGYTPAAPCAQHLLPPVAPRIAAEHQQARAALAEDDVVQALQRLRALTEAAPGALAARADLASLLLEQGKVREAAALAEAVLEVDPCMDSAWATVGIARLRGRDHRGAALDLTRAHEIDPHNPAHEAALGEALLRMGETDRAVPLLRSAARWAPELLPPRVTLGRHLLAEGRSDEALPLLAQAAALRPDAIELQALHGLAMLGTGDVAGAREILARAEADGVGHHLAMQTLRQGLEQAGGSFGGFQGPGSPP